MKGDFSRTTFNPRQQYTHVNMQQGRVQIDADWNEQQAIHTYQRRTRGSDVIGLCGTPAYSRNGFAIQQQGSEWEISAGHFYVDGILCVNDQTRAITNQPFPYANIPTLDVAAPGIVYLDVWQQHVAALQDDNIREKALGGADTATRIQTIWQVKFLPLAAVPDSSDLLDELRNQQPLTIPEWSALIGSSAGTLNARTNEAAITDTPCELPPSAGYVGLENQLYRVEIHNGPPAPTFKWSRNNASFAVAVESMPSDQSIVVASTGRDELLGFQHGDWVELVGDPDVFSNSPGQLAQVDQVNIDTRTITLMATITQVSASVIADGHYRLQRWEQSGPSATSNGVAINNDWTTLENGIQVNISSGSLRTGDFWQIPARTVTGQIEWPPNNPTSSPTVLPFGIDHHYCPLALFGNGSNTDLRLAFPPLNHITADDVRYDNTSAPNLSSADTVQEAIDILAHIRQDGCTLTAPPDTLGWESIFDELADGQDASICFREGLYILDAPIQIRNKGHLKLTGNGLGTRIVAQSSEVALLFENCSSVKIRDLSVESQVNANPVPPPEDNERPFEHLDGALTFRNCHLVHLDSLVLRCAPGLERAASCLRVDFPATSGEQKQITVHDCRFFVGHEQIGLLVTNTDKARIENNLFQINDTRSHFSLPHLLTNPPYRSGVRNLLIHQIVPNYDDENLVGGPQNNQVVINTPLVETGLLSFNTDPSVRDAWEQLYEEFEPRGVQNVRDLIAFLKHMANNLLVNGGSYVVGTPENLTSRTLTAFRSWYQRLNRENVPVAAQGIVVGGVNGRNIQIKGNTISNTRQGIHIGISQRSGVRRMEQVVVRENEIDITVSPNARERHGIFIGNGNDFIVTDNHLVATRLPATRSLPIDGIRVVGNLGRMVIIRQNYIENFTTGIRFAHFGPFNPEQPQQWLISDNLVPSGTNIVDIPSDIRPRVRGLSTNFA